MKRILVAFASKEGHTERIAHHVARRLEDKGAIVRLINLKTDNSEAGADDCDATIIAGSLHRGHHDASLAGFLMRHGPAIRQHRSAFLSVSLSAASHDREEIAALDELVQRFLSELGWQPDAVQHVAGAILDRQLSMIEKFILHRAAEAHGETLHPSGNTEFTNWERLDAFVDEFSRSVTAADVAAE